MKIISRTQAAKLGLSRFYTGKVCRNGHISERYTTNGVCCECQAEHSVSQRKRIKNLMAAASMREAV